MIMTSKYFKLICGVLIILGCALTFISSGMFGLFKGNILTFLAILLIMLGAGALIFISLRGDIEVIPDFSLSRIAKLLVTAGMAFILLYLLVRIGVSLILVSFVIVLLLYEDKVMKKFGKEE
jgi:hypothetical protein